MRTTRPTEREMAAMASISATLAKWIEEATTAEGVGHDVALVAAHSQIVAMMLAHLGPSDTSLALIRTCDAVGKVWSASDLSKLERMHPQGHA